METSYYLSMMVLHMLISMAVASQEIDCKDTAQHPKHGEGFVYWDLWLVLSFFTVLSSACVCIMNTRSSAENSGLDADSVATLRQNLGCMPDQRVAVWQRTHSREGIQVPLLEHRESQSELTTTTHSLKEYIAGMLSKLSTSRELAPGELRVGEASVSKIELTL